MRPRLVIFVKGGLIESIISDIYCEILVLDRDVDTNGDVRKIRDWDFSRRSPSDKEIEFLDAGPQEPDAVDPEAVDHFFLQMFRAEAFESDYSIGDKVFFENGEVGEIIMVDPQRDSNFIVRVDGIDYSVHPSHFEGKVQEYLHKGKN